MLKLTNKNYCATIAKIERIIPIAGADNIVAAIVLGNTVVVQSSAQVGDTGVFFPVETQLSHKFCHVNNLYDHPELNLDITKKGYINEKCRVRCVTLRKVTSEGLFLSLDSLFSFGFLSFKIGDEFNYIGEEEICKKYIIQDPGNQTPNPNKVKKTKTPGKPRESRLVEDQFRLHIDTEQLKKNMYKIDPGTLISITNKLHGTSAVFSKVLVKRRLTWLEKVAKYFGCAVVEQEYGLVVSSRNVIRNKYFDAGYDPTDIYSKVASTLELFIPNGFTIYGEIVGFKQSGGSIQKGYAYGCKPCENALYIYRITNTDSKGNVIELSYPQIQDYCAKYNLNVVPLFYYGYAKDLYDIPIDDDWSKNFLEKLSKDFNLDNRMCELNDKKVPAEGCVLRKEDLYHSKPYKIKNPKFLKRETEMLDAGEVDMESTESLPQE